MDLEERRAALRASLSDGEPAWADAAGEQRRREGLVGDVLAWAIDAARHGDIRVRSDLLKAFRGLCNGEWEPLRSGLDGVLAPPDPTRPPQTPQETEEASMVDLLDLEVLLVTVCGRPMPPPGLVARYGGSDL